MFVCLLQLIDVFLTNYYVDINQWHKNGQHGGCGIRLVWLSFIRQGLRLTGLEKDQSRFLTNSVRKQTSLSPRPTSLSHRLVMGTWPNHFIDFVLVDKILEIAPRVDLRKARGDTARAHGSKNRLAQR